MKIKVSIIGELDDSKFEELQKKISSATSLFEDGHYSENWEYKKGN
jgi:hypothetical protein